VKSELGLNIMIRYLIFRHGEAVIMNGITANNAPLTERGEAQARRLGERLMHFNATKFYTSALRRARQTAEIVNSYINLAIKVDERLNEVDSYHMFYETALYSNEVLGGKSTILGDFNKAQLKLAEFLDEQKKINDGKTVLLSAHGNVIKALMAITLGISDKDALDRLIIGNTGLTVLEWLKDDDYQLVVFNDTNHLGELMFR